jgi:hypothetical protein
MSLYRYFGAVSETPVTLPDPSGPLSKIVPSSSIEVANSRVSPLLTHNQTEKKVEKKTRGPYKKLTGEKRAEIGRRAAEHGVASTVRYYRRR